MSKDRLLTTQEVADLLRVSRHTVTRWIRSGRLRAIAITVGKQPVYRIRESDFRTFLRRYVEGLD